MKKSIRPRGGLERIKAEKEDRSIKPNKSLSIVLKPALREWLDYLASYEGIPAGVYLKRLLEEEISLYFKANRLYSEQILQADEFLELVNKLFILAEEGKLSSTFLENNSDMKIGYSQLIDVLLDDVYSFGGFDEKSKIGFLIIEGVKQYQRFFQVVVYERNESGENISSYAMTLTAEREEPSIANVNYIEIHGEKTRDIKAEEFFDKANLFLSRIEEY